MTDIVVTIPKREIKSFEKELIDLEKDDSLLKYYKVSSKPTKLKVGDSIYFCLNNKIRFKADVEDLDYIEMFRCETTGRQWESGTHVICNNFSPVEDGQVIKGFQGFRYKWW